MLYRKQQIQLHKARLKLRDLLRQRAQGVPSAPMAKEVQA